jgi:hypothetical protein
MNESLSTRELGWLLHRSPGAIRDMIRAGDIQGARIPAGFRIPRAEALRLARERIEAEVGRKLSEKDLEALIDHVIATNEART